MTKRTRERIEKFLIRHEGACSFSWSTGGEDCAGYDSEGNLIDIYMIDIEEDGVFCTPASNLRATEKIDLRIKPYGITNH